MANELFGTCPECPACPEEPGPYTVLYVDDFAYAICEEHKVMWNIGSGLIGIGSAHDGPEHNLVDQNGHCLIGPDGRLIKDPSYPNAEIRQNCRTLLSLKNVTEKVVKNMLFWRLPDAPPLSAKDPFDDMLMDFGLEARARGIIDYLGSDFMCFVGRDEQTGELIKINHRQNEIGEWIEEHEPVARDG
jgi:hypothetical protein